MANSSGVKTGAAAVMQDHLGPRIVANLVTRHPLLAILLGKDGTKMGPDFGLARPKSGHIYTGVPMSKTQREEILNSDRYMPAFDTILPPESDSKVLDMFDTMPDVADWKTNNPTAGIVRPFFKWVELATPILVPKKLIRRTKRKAGGEGPKASAAIGDMWKYQSEKSMTVHLNIWNKWFWGAGSLAPTNVNADVWDKPYSIRGHLKTDNNWGGADRAVAANADLRGNYDTTHRAADLVGLIHRANYDYGMADYGNDVQLYVVGNDLFSQFITQVDAVNGQVIYDGKLPGIGEFGFTKEVLRYRNAYVINDPSCPSKSKGDSTNAMLGINLNTVTIAVSPDANFEVDEPFDESKTRGGRDAIKSQIRTEMIYTFENPKANIWYEDVG